MLGGVKAVWGHALLLVRVFCIFLVALFLPKFFMIHINSTSHVVMPSGRTSFRLGVENISDAFVKKLMSNKKRDLNVGLVTNQSGKDQCGIRTLDILRAHGLNVVVLFAPEHGMDGIVEMGQDIHDGKDSKSNLRIVSLYDNGRTKKFDESLLQDIDVLVFDMQDSGMRHYTFITTMFQMLEAASAYHKVAVVLDRPNLLGPYMEGGLVMPAFKSAISYAPIPVRYGMTVGELALYFNQKILKKSAQLHVVPMKNYKRNSYNLNGLIAHLSPNIKSLKSCYGYSFLGLLGEIQPFDVGVGTDKAFQCILLPESLKFSKKKWHELHVQLKKIGINSSFYRHYSDRKKEYCSGLQVAIADINTFSSFGTLLDIIHFFKKTGVNLTFSRSFNKAMGSDKIRAFLDGKLTKIAFARYINAGLSKFFNKACMGGCFLYHPFPQIMSI